MNNSYCVRVKIYEPGDVVSRDWCPTKNALIIRRKHDEWGIQFYEAITEDFKKIIITSAGLPFTHFEKHVPLEEVEDSAWDDRVFSNDGFEVECTDWPVKSVFLWG